MMEDEAVTYRKRDRNWLGFLRDRVTEVVIAGMAVFLVVQVSEHNIQKSRDSTPASAWFATHEIFVPDHVQGSNPDMIYDRTIHEPFRGFFVVEVQEQQPNGLWFSACSGSGTSDYDEFDVIPDRTVAWVWFINRACPVPHGTYRLRVSWEMKRIGWPVKETVALSNVFTVSEN